MIARETRRRWPPWEAYATAALIILALSILAGAWLAARRYGAG